MTGADVAAEARSWIGTPFRWQASLKGVGCDCKGLVWGVARALGLPEAQSPFAKVCDYGRVVPCDVLLRGLAETFQPAPRTAFAPGDVLLLTVAGRPQHLAIADGDELIHAFGRGGARLARVMATRQAAALKLWPLHSAWRFGSLG